MRPDENDPAARRLDMDKLVRAATAIAKSGQASWEQEGEDEIQPHPVQTAPAC
jgi:hypothetical protein